MRGGIEEKRKDRLEGLGIDGLNWKIKEREGKDRRGGGLDEERKRMRRGKEGKRRIEDRGKEE
jgi:hypothetical protein